MAREATPGSSNGFKPELLQEFLKRIDNVKADIASETGTFMSTIKGMREDIKKIYTEAKDAGVPMRALKAEVKLRELDREKHKVVAGLEEEDRETLEMIQHALGDLASTPLGQAAQANAR